MFIIDDLLFWLPAQGLVALFKKIHELAEAELNDETKLKELLLKYQTMYELDQITEEEYQKREDEIIARLNEIRERKKREASST
jgi:DNA helicase IV